VSPKRKLLIPGLKSSVATGNNKEFGRKTLQMTRQGCVSSFCFYFSIKPLYGLKNEIYCIGQ